MADTVAATQPPLNDLMMAMDVVDTLRHGETLVERELSGEKRRAKMIERLREIYASQGITVPDRILEEGVDALEQERFVYKPKRGGFAFALARAYVNRGRIGRIAAIAVAVVVVVGGAWLFISQQAENQRQREAEEQRIAAEQLEIELAETIPAELERLANAISDEANDRAVAVEALVTATGRRRIGSCRRRGRRPRGCGFARGDARRTPPHLRNRRRVAAGASSRASSAFPPPTKRRGTTISSSRRSGRTVIHCRGGSPARKTTRHAP